MDEITKLLSQMGEDGGGGAGGESMKGHAERLWKFLDNLAESDPEEYQNFLKKQAEAAGVGLKARATRGGGAPESVEDHPRLVVLGLEEPSQGQDEREQQHVAILVFENRTDEDDQKGATFQELKLGFKLKSEIRLANHVDGLPRIQGKYKVVEILTPPSVLSHVVPSDPEDPRLATAKAGAPEEGETRSKLDLFVDSVARWSQKRMGRKLQGRRKVLMLKSRAYKNREAAMGTAASDLPETILSKIADMGGPREGGGASRAMAGGVGGSEAAGVAPERRVLIEEIATGGGACVTSHRTVAPKSGEGTAKIKAEVAEGVAIGDLQIHLDEAGRALVFSAEDREDYSVQIPAGAGSFTAKYSQSSHRVTVHLSR